MYIIINQWSFRSSVLILYIYDHEFYRRIWSNKQSTHAMVSSIYKISKISKEKWSKLVDLFVVCS